MEIKETGSLTTVDKDGFLINSAHIGEIQGDWKDLIDEFVEIQKHHLGDKIQAIYIRGSVAKGEAFRGLSDVDTLTILNISKEELENLDLSWVKEEKEKLWKEYTFQTGVEFVYLTTDNLSFGNKFLIKTQAVCVCGDDISDSIEPFKLSTETIKKLRFKLGQNVKDAIEGIEKTDKDRIIKRDLTWICKRFLRHGFLFVSVRENAYTRDLYPSYKLFSKHYPERESEMKKALEYVINPIIDKREAVEFIKNFGEWIIEENKKLFNK